MILNIDSPNRTLDVNIFVVEINLWSKDILFVYLIGLGVR